MDLKHKQTVRNSYNRAVRGGKYAASDETTKDGVFSTLEGKWDFMDRLRRELLYMEDKYHANKKTT